MADGACHGGIAWLVAAGSRNMNPGDKGAQWRCHMRPQQLVARLVKQGARHCHPQRVIVRLELVEGNASAPSQGLAAATMDSMKEVGS